MPVNCPRNASNCSYASSHLFWLTRYVSRSAFSLRSWMFACRTDSRNWIESVCECRYERRVVTCVSSVCVEVISLCVEASCWDSATMRDWRLQSGSERSCDASVIICFSSAVRWYSASRAFVCPSHHLHSLYHAVLRLRQLALKLLVLG